MKFQFMRLAICFISLASCFLPSRAFAQQPYYQNKTIRIIRGGEPGGSGDLQARALIPFLKKIYLVIRRSSLRTCLAQQAARR